MKKKIFILLTNWVSNWWFRFPSRKTNLILLPQGESSLLMAQLLELILSREGEKVGFLSSAKATLNKEELKIGAEVNWEQSWSLQRYLQEMVSRGANYILLLFPFNAAVISVLEGVEKTLLLLPPKEQKRRHQREEEGRWWQKLASGTPFLVLPQEHWAYSFLQRQAAGKKVSYGPEAPAQVRSAKVQSGEWGLFFYYTNSQSLWKNQLSLDRALKLKKARRGDLELLLGVIAAATTLNVPEFRIRESLEEFFFPSSKSSSDMLK